MKIVRKMVSNPYAHLLSPKDCDRLIQYLKTGALTRNAQSSPFQLKWPEEIGVISNLSCRLIYRKI
ncbi:MAG: hypothetical protein MJA27_24500 [Pseudanabaenales cyanobacterium]|nr:hypothetical protein [Pseudanabaenales cyanobacterium]